MSKAEMFLILNQLDDDLIEESVTAGAASRRHLYLRGAVAACLAIAIGVTFMTARYGDGHNGVVAGTGDATGSLTDGTTAADTPKGKKDITTIPGAKVVDAGDIPESDGTIDLKIAPLEVFVQEVKKTTYYSYIYGTAKNISIVEVEDDSGTIFIATFDLEVIDAVQNTHDITTDTIKCIFVDSDHAPRPECPTLWSLKDIIENPTALYSIFNEQFPDAAFWIYEFRTGLDKLPDGLNPFDYADYGMTNAFKCNGETFNYYGGEPADLDLIRG